MSLRFLWRLASIPRFVVLMRSEFLNGKGRWNDRPQSPHPHFDSPGLCQPRTGRLPQRARQRGSPPLVHCSISHPMKLGDWLLLGLPMGLISSSFTPRIFWARGPHLPKEGPKQRTADHVRGTSVVANIECSRMRCVVSHTRTAATAL